MRPPLQDELLTRHLSALLDGIEPATLDLLRDRLDWVVLPGGQTLMTQGEPGDSMYIAVSGRLRAYVRGDDGVERMVREMARGQVIGEMSLYTDEPRSATVVAIRDSVLVRLGKADFHALLAASPKLSIALTRQIIGRLRAPQPRGDLARPVTIALMPVSAGVDGADIARRLAEPLRRAGRVAIVDAAALDAALGRPGAARHDAEDAELNRRIALHLDEVEAGHEYLLLVADAEPGAWTQRCSRRCDELMLLADATEAPHLHANEAEVLMRRGGRSEAAETLVLLHPAHTRMPRGTRAWLDRRPVARHVHVRPALARDMARLARLHSRTAVALVLAGGGARGIAHLGVFQALKEHGIEVDIVVGTSIGAVVGSLLATDGDWDEVMATARRAFGGRPTADFNLLPLQSLLKGRRLNATVQDARQALMGFDGDVEDLWLNFACVASNYSSASELLIERGDLRQAIMASAAIPGALPPVLRDGELLCDGGTFNNFPVDVARGIAGVGQVIGVDLAYHRARRIEHAELPGSWALLRDMFRPRGRRRYHLPGLITYLMNVTVMYSSSRQRQAQRLTDLYFNPPLPRVGMLQWSKFESIVELGHAHACEVLAARAATPAAPVQRPLSAAASAPARPARTPPAAASRRP